MRTPEQPLAEFVTNLRADQVLREAPRVVRRMLTPERTVNAIGLAFNR